MSLAFALLVTFALLLALVAVIYNLGTGRNLFDAINNAAFLYSLHRRQYMRGRWAAIKETWKEIHERP